MRLLALAIGVFLLALATRAIVWQQLRSDPEFHVVLGDPAKYDQWARNITAGDWLSRGEGVFYQAPLYPYFLAFHYTIFGDGNVTAVRITQIILGSLGAVLLGLAARRIGSGLAGLLAGIMWALQPAAVFFDLQLDKATLDGALVCAILFVAAGIIDRPKWWQIPLVGALVGLLSLSRENAVTLMLVILPLAWHAGRRVERWPIKIEHWLFPILVGVAFLLVVLPVTIRNRVVGGEWHLLTSQFGPNFYIGNGHGADGVYRPLRAGRGDPRFERTDATELAEARERRKLSPREVSRFWTWRALDAMGEAPGRTVRLLVRKWLMVWHRAEIADNNDIDRLCVSSLVLRWLDSALHAGVLVPLAAAGVVLAWPLRARWGWIAAMALVMSLAVALFYLFARYRFPILPMVTLLAAVGLSQLPTAIKQKWTILVAVLVAAGVAILANAQFILPERIRGADHYNRALAWEYRGQAATAETEYRRAIAANPSLAAAYNNLGLLLNQRHAYDQAIEVLTRGLAARPRDPLLQNNLGMAYGGKGELARAIECFEAALRLAPDYQVARENLLKARQMLESRR